MLFVVNKSRLQRMIGITRDDRSANTQEADGPFLRIEANDGHLRLTGRVVDAEFPATVYEPGVLFLRVTKFRRMLRMMTVKGLGMRELTFQLNRDGLTFGDVHLPFEIGDMLLYPDPQTAPGQHPQDRLSNETGEGGKPTEDDGNNKATPPDPQGSLFGK
jgi:hypothetical protein